MRWCCKDQYAILSPEREREVHVLLPFPVPPGELKRIDVHFLRPLVITNLHGHYEMNNNRNLRTVISLHFMSSSSILSDVLFIFQTIGNISIHFLFTFFTLILYRNKSKKITYLKEYNTKKSISYLIFLPF